MGDKTNYQAMRFDPHPTQRMVDACCARIATLEDQLDAAKVKKQRAERRADKAEAALAERDRMLEDMQTELLQAALDHGFSVPTLARRRARAEEGSRDA